MISRPFTHDVETVAAALNDGAVAIVPTDTVYGVAASLQRPAAIERIFTAKGRPSDKPIPILVADPASADRFVACKSEAADHLIRAFWPGALTIVFAASDAVPPPCLAIDGTVGIRMPAHAALQRLIEACGGALAVTSANRSGEPETSSAEAAFAALADYVECVLDWGDLQAGPPSTVVKPDGRGAKVLRHGAIDAEDIATALAGTWD